MVALKGPALILLLFGSLSGTWTWGNGPNGALTGTWTWNWT